MCLALGLVGTEAGDGVGLVVRRSRVLPVVTTSRINRAEGTGATTGDIPRRRGSSDSDERDDGLDISSERTTGGGEGAGAIGLGGSGCSGSLGTLLGMATKSVAMLIRSPQLVQ